MAKPWIHSLQDVKKWGGLPTDYLPIHNFMDSSKAHIADVRHRALFHSSFGCFIAELVFGTNITNSDGKLVSVRDIAEGHVISDLHFIPTVQDYLKHMTIEPWMSGAPRETKTFKFDEEQKPPVSATRAINENAILQAQLCELKGKFDKHCELKD